MLFVFKVYSIFHGLLKYVNSLLACEKELLNLGTPGYVELNTDVYQ